MTTKKQKSITLAAQHFYNIAGFQVNVEVFSSVWNKYCLFLF